MFSFKNNLFQLEQTSQGKMILMIFAHKSNGQNILDTDTHTCGSGRHGRQGGHIWN